MSLRVPTRSLRALLASALLLLGACASAPGIPETTWHRLPAAAAPARLGTPSALPIVVQRLEADGLHADQALLYALDPNGQRLRAYHYHLWVDPPGYLLQRRLIARLYAAGAAARVTDQLSTRLPAVWVTGRIERFERVPRAGGGYEAHVGQPPPPPLTTASPRRYRRWGQPRTRPLTASCAMSAQHWSRPRREPDRTHRTPGGATPAGAGSGFEAPARARSPSSRSAGTTANRRDRDPRILDAGRNAAGRAARDRHRCP